MRRTIIPFKIKHQKFIFSTSVILCSLIEKLTSEQVQRHVAARFY